MHKKLFKCGNSMAITIDAHTRRSLGINETTLLHVTQEGRRIVIEKSACDRPPTIEPVAANATHYNRRVIEKLMNDFDAAGMTRDRFARLSPDNQFLFSFIPAAKLGQPINAVTVARLLALFAKLKGGLAWEAAIDETLAEVPPTLEPTMLVATDQTISATPGSRPAAPAPARSAHPPPSADG